MAHNDSELVGRSLDGDHEAFAEIYDRYARLVRAVCFETARNFPDAQELCQEVFVRAWQKLETLQNADRVGAWLTGIARHTSREWQRGQRNHEVAGDEISQPVDRDNAERCERLEHLFQALEELPEKERMAIHLFYLEGQAAERSRSILGLSTSGFYRVLECARKRLACLVTRKEAWNNERTHR